jgi:hypothetical protein
MPVYNLLVLHHCAKHKLNPQKRNLNPATIATVVEATPAVRKRPFG